MSFNIIKPKVWGSALIKMLTPGKKAINTAGKQDIGIALKQLNCDTVQITGSTRLNPVTPPIMKTAPAVYKGTQVPMHHDLNGDNTNIREAYKAVTGTTPLSKREMSCAQYTLPEIHQIDKEFAKLPPLEKDCIVWRGRSEHPIIKRFNEDFIIINNAKVGDIVVPDTGYSYTAFEKKLAENWSCPMEGQTMMFKIRLPKGAKVSRNLEHGGEVIMPRNAEYKLLSKTQNGNHIEVELEYILPQKYNVAEIEELMRKFKI